MDFDLDAELFGVLTRVKKRENLKFKRKAEHTKFTQKTLFLQLLIGFIVLFFLVLSSHIKSIFSVPPLSQFT